MKKIFTFCVSLLAALSVFAYDFQSGDLFYNITSSSAPYTVEVTQQSQYYNSNYSGVDTIVIPETVTYNSIIYSVTSIGESAFDHSKLTTITIPNTVTSIGEYAFAYCQKLTSVAIGSGVKTIHMAAFNNCSALRTITIPANVKEIYNQAFTGASISTIYMEGTTPPSLLQSKSDGSAFMIFSTTPTCYVPCSAVASYKASTKWKGAVREFVAEFPYTFTIASANTSLGTIAITQQPDCSTAAIFEAIPNTGCYFTQWSDGNTDNPRTLKVTQDTRLTASFASSTYVVNLIAGANGAVSGAGTYDHGTTATITAIPNDGYHFTQWSDGNTDNPRSIIVVEPISLTALFEENYTQEHCQIIYTSTDGDVVTPWVTYNFGADIVSNTYADGQGVITFDGPVTAIGDTAFANCSSLESIIIPDRVTVIGDQAFQYCTYLKDVTIGNRVESIGTAAFNNCSSLRSIIIPQSVKYIYNYAFVGASLNSIYVNRTIPPTLNPEREDPYMVLGTGMVDVCYIPCGKLASYQASEWKTKGQVREFVERPSYLLTVQSVDKTMGTATITQDIDCETQIATIAATPYDGYRFVQWSDGNTDNPRSWVVTEDTYLEAIFEKSIDPTWQITYTSTDGNIVTPNATDVFGANIVSNTYENGIGTITFDGPVTSIGKDAFAYRNSLTSITIPGGVTNIRADALAPCSSLTSIVVANGNTTYDSRENSNAIIETATNTLIAGCRNTIIPNNVTSIGDSAFISRSKLSSITIPNSVTSIGDYAFGFCFSLTSITIPNSVTSIGDYAFCVCDSLTSITIPNSVTSIGDYAFALCFSLTSITIPNSVTSIGDYAFRSCSSLTSVTIPNSVTEIGNYAFDGCSSLTSITIPNSVTSIGNGAFRSCSSLTSVNIPHGITNIASATFGACTSLKSITIPNSVTSIGESAFNECSSLISITIPESVTSIGEWAFAFCESLTSVNIPHGITNIASATFGACTSLKSIIIPNSVTSIGELAFALCESLTSVNIPHGITNIASHTFEACTSLKSIIIPNSVTSIGDQAFLDCSALDTILIEATTPPALGSGVFTDSPVSTCIIPCGTKAAYEASDWAQYVSEFVEEDCVDPTWQILYTSIDSTVVTPYKTDVFGANIVSNTYQDGQGVITFDGPVTSIGDSAFYKCSGMALITIPNSVASIGDYAFDYCYSLTSITIPNSVTSIGHYAFRYCSSLTSITIPNSVTSIGRWAFFSCSSLSSVTIGNSVTSIGDYAFVSCTSLTSLTIPNSVTSIGESAFSDCDDLSSMVVEEGNTKYDSRENCNAIIEKATNTLIAGCQNTTIPNSVTSIGESAFRWCSSLASITIPNSVTSIGNNAFVSCSSLTSLTIPNSVTSIGNGAFEGCSSLTSITIPNSVTSIGYEAFLVCSSLTSITIPNSVTSIEYGTFWNCSSLTSITIPNSVTSIGDDAFVGCSSLDTIYVEATTPTTLGQNVFEETPSPLCVIPCGTLAEYEMSRWKNYVEAFVFDDTCDSKWCGDELYWKYGDGVLTIIGIGDMYDYASDIDVPWYDVHDKITSINIPNGVSKIGNNAFASCISLDEIYVEAAMPPALGNNALASSPSCFIPCGAIATYQSSNWAQYVSEFVEVCPTVVKAKVPASWENDDITVWVWTDGAGTEYPTTKEGDWYVYTHSDAEEFNIIFKSGTGWKDEIYHRTQTVDIKGITENTCLEIQPTTGKATYTIVDCEIMVDTTEYFITYTSTDGNIVTPYATDVFGANIVSNTYENGVGTITFDGPVTSIGYWAFYSCESLTSITIPNSVTSIGNNAFYNCYGLTLINIPNSVTSIGNYAFNYCRGLTSITIPNSVTSIGDRAFEGCSRLTSITIPNSVTSIGSGAFSYCSGLTSIVVDGGNTTYDSRENCNTIIETATNTLITGCQNTIIPNSVTSIGEWAFYYCYGLTSVTIPNSVTSIGEGAFSGCSGLTSIVVDVENTTYDSRENCNAIIETATNTIITGCQNTIIPNSVMSIGNSAFEGCYDLTSITIPNSVTSIGNYAFYNCHGLTLINIPNSVTSIGFGAFHYCYGLTSVTIPNSVTSIGYRAFNGCSSLDTIHIEAITPPTLGTEAVTSSPTCYIPCGTLAAYEASDWASQVGEFVEDCVEGQQIYYTSTDGNIVTPNATDVFGANIVSNEYKDGQGVITFDGPVTSIGDFAFCVCDSLTSITIPNSVTSIGDYAFGFCFSLTSITIPNSVTSIEDYAFQTCSSLTSVTIPNSVTSIGNNAFSSCSSLTDIAIPNSVTSIGNGAFSRCSSLTSITIPNSITEINSGIFDGCSSLTSITIPNSVTSIGNDAFSSCSSLTSITIPNGITSIGERAFFCCESLTIVNIPNDIANIAAATFDVCTSLKSITIPNSVTSIGDWAFGRCFSLDTIHVEATTPPALEDSTVFMGTPAPVCVIPCGTLAAYEASDWASQVGEFVEDCVEGQQIYYTSTNGNIVTPHDTTGFGANIVSNTYEDNQGVITFDGLVTSIGDSAFHECESLASITIPTSVTSIGDGAFAWCSSLTSITIPNSVTSIGSLAFRYCTSLTSMTVENGNTVYDSRENCNAIIETATNTLIAGCQNTIIPNSVTSIGDGTFVNCTSLTSITIPESVTSIGGTAFLGCTSLTSITIPESVTSIGGSAFLFCTSLTSVTFGSGVTSIGWSAFHGCTSLTSITCEATTPPTLGEYVFTGTLSPVCVVPCGTLAVYEASDWANYMGEFVEKCVEGQQITYTSTNDSIVTPNDVNVFGANIVSNIYENGVGTITFDGPVTSIGDYAFYDCNLLTSVNIPNSVMSIGFNAFGYCGSITSIILPNSVTSIGSSVFCNCSSLTSVNIPNSVMSIGFDAFDDTGIYNDESNWDNDVLYIDECLITTKDSSIVSYIIKDSTRLIANGAFEDCMLLTSITIPNGVITIGLGAFEGCSALTSLVIPNTVISIGNNAFSLCTSLESVIISEGIKSIGGHVFSDCTNLRSLTIPKSVTSLGDDYIPIAVRVPNLSSIYVAEGNSVYDSRNNCNAIIETATNTLLMGCQNTVIPNDIKRIECGAFLGAITLTTIDIPTSVDSIGYAAFANTGITKIAIPSNTIIEDTPYNHYGVDPSSGEITATGAFSDCKQLTDVSLPEGMTSIPNFVFSLCSSLSSIVIPRSVTTIKRNAFSDCISLTTITIPENVSSIERYAFENCSALTDVYVKATTPPALDLLYDTNVFTSSPICHIPCGTLAVYEASDWASQVGEFVEEGCVPIQQCGDNLFWEYADGVLTITGTGDMYDYADDKTGPAPWYDVRGSITTINMPNEMTKIGDYAFYKCTEVTSINMPTTLTAIGEKAFAQDTKLACEIILPASMTNIATRAFFNCKAVPAFHVEATIPPTVQADAFDYTTAPIHVPCGYGHIYGKHTQWGMLNLEMCELLQDNVYYYPIDGHTARAVTYHSNPTDTLVIPSAVVIDGMPRTVTELADFAFTDCANLPAISFNEGLEYIGERAFVRCYGLQGTIVLPATLETIGERAFSYCDNVEKYLIQAMTPPALGDGAFTCANHDALFYVSCEVMDDYKVAARWSSLKSRLRDACLNIYHYNTALGANGVHTTEDTLVASIYYRRQFTPYRWETLYLPFEVDRVTVLEDGVEYDLTAWDIVDGGHYFLAKPDGMLNKEILFGFTDELASHTPYIIQFSDAYYTDKLITFYGKESWNKLSTSFEVLSSSAWMQIAGNTTLQDQLLEKPVYMLRSGLDFILQKTTTTLHPFECYVMPYTAQSGAPARMNVRLRDDVATAVESVKGNESRLAYTINDHTLTVYPQGQAFSIYSLNGALIYSCEAGKEAVDCELNSGCYLLHAGAEAHKIML